MYTHRYGPRPTRPERQEGTVKIKKTLAERLDEIASKHGWERTHGGEHAFRRTFHQTRARVTFSMRGNGDLRVGLFNLRSPGQDTPDYEAMATLAPGRGGAADLSEPKFEEKAEAFLERTLIAFDLRKVQAAIVKRRLDDVVSLERRIAGLRSELASYATWFDAESGAREQKIREA